MYMLCHNDAVIFPSQVMNGIDTGLLQINSQLVIKQTYILRSMTIVR